MKSSKVFIFITYTNDWFVLGFNWFSFLNLCYKQSLKSTSLQLGKVNKSVQVIQ